MAKVLEGLAFLAVDPTVHRMCQVIGAMVSGLVVVGMLCTSDVKGRRNWLPDCKLNSCKRNWEVFSLTYGVFWITCFAIIIGGELYESFDREHYMIVCGGLATPLLLQPILLPSITGESDVPLFERYSLKANLWIFIFGFIGNYWYTHYFYNVLEAHYSMPSWDLNGVPIPMYLATHFYFCFYHVLSNLALRKAYSTFSPGAMRRLFVISLVLIMSYATAFMESLTISGFPCYGFKDRDLAYTLGSAFYGIYFIVSFPMFLRLDESPPKKWDLFTVAVEALASGMAVLMLLDIVRVYMGIDLNIRLNRPCKLNAAFTCKPFNFKTC
uniref:Cycloeucalenol cycloisomerase n=1 Tax=Amorphochlora amoebiformis TaxID=1561963 RepID=A0A7S0DTR5_9EUKA